MIYKEEDKEFYLLDESKTGKNRGKYIKKNL